jgi:hypothetical protein
MTKDTKAIVEAIGFDHRRRRFAMKIQSKLDRALESHLRIYFTDWDPKLPEAEREKYNAEVKAMIKRLRAGKLKGEADLEPLLYLQTSDAARAPADEMRSKAEKQMEKFAKTLPVYR